MSRIGNKVVNIPAGVTVNVADNNFVTVKGPKGELSFQFNNEMTISVSATEVAVKRPNDTKEMKTLHGTTRALINNMVKGVTEGYTVEQEIVGLGYRVTVTGQNVELALGYSHTIIFQLPKEIKAEAKSERGSNPMLTMTSCDKQLLGQVAAKIRSLRAPEPYKGKGIKFKGEQLRRKAGKSAGK